MAKMPAIPQAWSDQPAIILQQASLPDPGLANRPGGLLDGWQSPAWSLENSGLNFLLHPDAIAQIDFGDGGSVQSDVTGAIAPARVAPGSNSASGSVRDESGKQNSGPTPVPTMATSGTQSEIGMNYPVESTTVTAYRLKRDVKGNLMPDLPNMIARDKWARYAPESGKLNPQNPSAIHELVLHHTGNQATAQDVETIHRHHDGLTAYARDAGAPFGITDSYKKYGDVGYHYLIAPDGTIYEGRSIYYQGAHVKNHNDHTIGVAFIGNYKDKPLTKAALDSLTALTGSLEAVTGNKLYHSTHGLYDARKGNELRGAFGQIDSLIGSKPMNR